MKTIIKKDGSPAKDDLCAREAAIRREVNRNRRKRKHAHSTTKAM